MGAFKEYCKEEIQLRNLRIEHSKPADFYLSVWQTNRSPVPLLILRTLIFLTSLAIVLASMSLYILNNKIQFWCIYLTHWGLTAMTLASLFAVIVSARSYIYGPLNSEFLLPWYVKVYWVLYNVAVPLAFLITLFYWTVLYEAGVDEELDHALDLLVHAVNTLLMFLLLITSSQPSRLMHFYHPVCIALTYFFFGLIYYLAGGTDPEGNPYVYAVVDWRSPGPTIGVALLTGLLLVLLYLLMVAIAKGRDTMSKKFVKPPTPVEEAGVPLRQQTAV